MEQVLIAIAAMGSMGLVFGIVLSLLNRKLYVEEDPRVKEVLDILPGINCGACGFSGCRAYAKAAVAKKDLMGGCRPGGEQVNRMLAGILGVEVKPDSPLKVIVLCGAKYGEKKISVDYKGPKTCNAANQTSANIDCKYGCLGFGDCTQVCPVNALSLDNGKVIVDYNLCAGCGKCVEVCPRNILELVEIKGEHIYTVACRNPEDALSTKKVCSIGCIGCTLCTKVIKDSPFYMEEKVSRIDYEKIKGVEETDLDKTKDKCPVGIIKKIDLRPQATDHRP